MGKLSIALVGLCTALPAWAVEAPADFSAQVPLAISGEGPWYRLELPLAVQLSARQADLSDLRVFNAAGEPQAYALVRQSAESAKNVARLKGFPLYAADTTSDSVRVQSSATGTLVQVQPSSEAPSGVQVRRGWLLDASAIKAPLQKLILDWSAEHDGFQRFSIEASDDLQHWRSWGEGQVARLAFADERVELREVALPGQPARYLRLLWQGQAAPELTSIEVQSTSSLPLPLVWSEPLAGSPLESGQYSWQLPGALSIERVRVELRQPNSLAPVGLQGRQDSKQAWQPLSRGLLYRLTQNGQEITQDQLQLPGYPVRQLKLDVDERGGGLGAQAPGLSFAVRATQVVFLARGEPPFTLALGNPSAKSANLPLTTLIPGYQPQRLAALGQARVDGEWHANPVAAPNVAGIRWQTIGLWAVLLLGVAALGAMAYSLLRKPPAKP
ncbi:DUF3999 domain-containing protein [Pseudomonas sp. WS 5027]|uniref:DUF3999 family protein n=1 Tax=unclassified Pseudomonas TaxID=196821 RepID=UPI0014745BA1|nr:DUF3999 domain-containing protein [Pseudomonas sp. WS 5086]NMY44571.1 DUF3999 domain-containing protein [Pseudomonas sp. WS 5027]